MNNLLIKDNVSAIYPTAYRQTYSYDLQIDKSAIFSVSIPRLAISLKTGFMRYGYYYYEHKYLVRISIYYPENTQGLCLVNETLPSKKTLFYGNQVSKIDYVNVVVSRRSNILINTSPFFKTSIESIASSHLANITTLYMYSINGPRYLMDSIYISFNPQHAPLYFIIEQYDINYRDLTPTMVPYDYLVLLYWW